MDATKYENKANTGVDDILPPKAKKVEAKEAAPPKGAPEVVEIVVVKTNNGIEKGEIKKVFLNGATTQYMIDNGYWKIK